MKLTKRRAIGAVAAVLGWRANPKMVTVTGTPEMPIYTMQVGKVLVEVGTAASLADVPFDSRPERYGMRTIIYMELRLPERPVELLATRFFFLDTLEEAYSRGEYQRFMDAIDMCEGFGNFDADAARTYVHKYVRRDAIAEERQAPPAGRPEAEK